MGGSLLRPYGAAKSKGRQNAEQIEYRKRRNLIFCAKGNSKNDSGYLKFTNLYFIGGHFDYSSRAPENLLMSLLADWNASDVSAPSILRVDYLTIFL